MFIFIINLIISFIINLYSILNNILLGIGDWGVGGGVLGVGGLGFGGMAQPPNPQPPIPNPQSPLLLFILI